MSEVGPEPIWGDNASAYNVYYVKSYSRQAPQGVLTHVRIYFKFD